DELLADQIDFSDQNTPVFSLSTGQCHQKPYHLRKRPTQGHDDVFDLSDILLEAIDHRIADKLGSEHFEE
ncbi:MAG TPA: hypothetical protein VIK48_05120, partial [Candidatus Manganitrophaceae bacterium]